MRVEMRPVYIAEDGQEYDTEKMCRQHEKLVELEAFFERYGWSGMSANDIVITITEHFDTFSTIVEKLRAEL